MNNPSNNLNKRSDLQEVDVSIIIGSYNRAEMLAQTLASLTALDTQLDSGDHFTYEVVVIDNASTDNTQEIISNYTSDDQRGTATQVRGFFEEQAGVTYARNCGIHASVGKWIAFHDDDQKAHPRWLAELINLADRRNLKIAGGAVQLLLPESNTRVLSPQLRQLLGEKVGMTTEQPYGRKRIPGTNNLLVRRSILDEVGIFDTRIKNGGEDAELYRRIRTAGYQAWFTPKAIVYHIIPEARMENEYMRWTATRIGHHLALRELNDWGRLGLAFMLLARTGQAGLNYLPRYMAALVTRHQEKRLGIQSLLWRSRAYLTEGWKLLVRGNQLEESPINFREGRELLVKGKKLSN